jgi:hypothetical protein
LAVEVVAETQQLAEVEPEDLDPLFLEEQVYRK